MKLQQIKTFLTSPFGGARGLWPLEWALVTYLCVTLLIMAILNTSLSEPWLMLRTRGICFAAIALTYIVYRRWPNQWWGYVRVAMPLMLLSQLYPDTYEFSRTFDNMDHVFAAIDQSIFGYQPSLYFSQAWPSWLLCEALSMGYSAYFFLIWVVVTWFWLRKPDQLQRISFVILASFFIYYMVFLFLPVGGPQFYYQAEGVDPVNGIFPEMGRYFDTHTEMFPRPGQDDGGFFSYLVGVAHEAGERPTAAFPSSHIGITNILVILAFRHRQRLLGWFLMPLFILLSLATVYIHAHYFIDAICGFVTSFLVYFLAEYLYKRVAKATAAS